MPTDTDPAPHVLATPATGPTPALSTPPEDTAVAAAPHAPSHRGVPADPTPDLRDLDLDDLSDSGDTVTLGDSRPDVEGVVLRGPSRDAIGLSFHAPHTEHALRAERHAGQERTGAWLVGVGFNGVHFLVESAYGPPRWVSPRHFAHLVMRAQELLVPGVTPARYRLLTSGTVRGLSEAVSVVRETFAHHYGDVAAFEWQGVDSRPVAAEHPVVSVAPPILPLYRRGAYRPVGAVVVDGDRPRSPRVAAVEELGLESRHGRIADRFGLGSVAFTPEDSGPTTHVVTARGVQLAAPRRTDLPDAEMDVADWLMVDHEPDTVLAGATPAGGWWGGGDAAEAVTHTPLTDAAGRSVGVVFHAPSDTATPALATRFVQGAGGLPGRSESLATTGRPVPVLRGDRMVLTRTVVRRGGLAPWRGERPFFVFAHGTPDGTGFTLGLDAAKAARRVVGDGLLPQDTSVIALIACQAGARADGPAQDLATALAKLRGESVRVVAPTTRVGSAGDVVVLRDGGEFRSFVPREEDRLDEVRRDRPEMHVRPDAAGLREAVLGLLGDLADDRRDQVAAVFSDEQVRLWFPSALDGGYPLQLGTRVGDPVPEFVVTVVGIEQTTGTLEGHDTEEEADESAHKALREQSALFVAANKSRTAETTAETTRAAPSALTRALYLPLPHSALEIKAGNVLNTRNQKSSFARKLSATGKLVETASVIDPVPYRVRVRVEARWPSDGARPSFAEASMTTGFNWPAEGTEVATPRTDPVRDNVEHADLTGLQDLFERTSERVGGFRANDPEVRRFRTWLDGLHNDVGHLFKGRDARMRFDFHGHRGTAVVIRLAGSRTLLRARQVAGKVDHSEWRSQEFKDERGVKRKRGGQVALYGNPSPVPLLDNGLWVRTSAGQTRESGDTSLSTYEHERTVTNSYEGDLERQRFAVTYVLGVFDRDGRRLDEAALVKAEAAVWMRIPPAPPQTDDHPVEQDEMEVLAEHAMVLSETGEWPLSDTAGVRAAPEPGPVVEAEPGATEANEVRNRVTAAYVMNRDQVDAVVQPIVHRLHTEGVVRRKDVAQVLADLRLFVESNARQLAATTDGVRYPLSAVRRGYPDVFISAAMTPAQRPYLGKVEGEQVSVKTTVGYEQVETRTRAVETEVDASVTVRAVSDRVTEVAAATVSYSTKRERTEGTAEKSTIEQSSKADVHRWLYDLDLSVSFGGRWGERAPVLTWPGGDDLHTQVEVRAPRLSTAERSPLPTGPADHSWRDVVRDDLDSVATDTSEYFERQGVLPMDYDIAVLRPIPRLLTTLSAMLTGPEVNRVLNGVLSPLVGTKRRNFDEHVSQRWVGSSDRARPTVDEHDGTLAELEAFADVTARIGRFHQAAVWRDTIRPSRPGTGGLVGWRELTGRADLVTFLGDPRVLAVEEHEFKFQSTTSVSDKSKDQRTSALSFSGRLAAISPWGAARGYPGMEVLDRYSRGTERSSTRTGRDGRTRARTDRGYLVSYTAVHELRAGARNDWWDALGFQHKGSGPRDVLTAAKNVIVHDAVRVWVPASEIHLVGELDQESLARLVEEDAARVRAETQREAAGQNAAAAPAAQEASPGAATPDSATPETVAPPPLTGRGIGYVQLHHHGKEAEFIERVGALLTTHAAQFPSVQRTVKEVQLRLSRLGVNQQLDAMLNGGLSIFVPMDVAIGKIEHHVHIRGVLRNGRHDGRLAGEEVTNTQRDRTKDRSGKNSHHTDQVNVTGTSVRSPLGEGVLLATGGRFGVSRDAAETSEHTVDQVSDLKRKNKGDARRFLHDLDVKVTVRTYARRSPLGTVVSPLVSDTSKYRNNVVDDGFAVEDAVRSVVPESDLTERAPIEVVRGSWRAQREWAGRPLSVRPDARMLMSWHSARELRAAVRQALGLDRDGMEVSSVSVLRPQAMHGLEVGLSFQSLHRHLPELLSENGYRITAHGRGPLKALIVHLDLGERALESVHTGEVERQERETLTHTRGTDYVYDLQVGTSLALHPPLGGEASKGRVDLMSTGLPLTSMSNKQENVAVTVLPRIAPKKNKATTTEHYGVRAAPRWVVTPEYRDGRTASPVPSEVDEPMRLWVDAVALAELGLTAPVVKGSGEERGSALPARAGEPRAIPDGPRFRTVDGLTAAVEKRLNGPSTTLLSVAEGTGNRALLADLLAGGVDAARAARLQRVPERVELAHPTGVHVAELSFHRPVLGGPSQAVLEIRRAGEVVARAEADVDVDPTADSPGDRREAPDAGGDLPVELETDAIRAARQEVERRQGEWDAARDDADASARYWEAKFAQDELLAQAWRRGLPGVEPPSYFTGRGVLGEGRVEEVMGVAPRGDAENLDAIIALTTRDLPGDLRLPVVAATRALVAERGAARALERVLGGDGVVVGEGAEAVWVDLELVPGSQPTVPDLAVRHSAGADVVTPPMGYRVASRREAATATFDVDIAVRATVTPLNGRAEPVSHRSVVPGALRVRFPTGTTGEPGLPRPVTRPDAVVGTDLTVVATDLAVTGRKVVMAALDELTPGLATRTGSGDEGRTGGRITRAYRRFTGFLSGLETLPGAYRRRVDRIVAKVRGGGRHTGLAHLRAQAADLLAEEAFRTGGTDLFAHGLTSQEVRLPAPVAGTGHSARIVVGRPEVRFVQRLGETTDTSVLFRLRVRSSFEVRSTAFREGTRGDTVRGDVYVRVPSDQADRFEEQLGARAPDFERVGDRVRTPFGLLGIGATATDLRQALTTALRADAPAALTAGDQAALDGTPAEMASAFGVRVVVLDDQAPGPVPGRADLPWRRGGLVPSEHDGRQEGTGPTVVVLHEGEGRYRAATREGVAGGGVRRVRFAVPPRRPREGAV
ncbi:hypothetical protein ACFWN2_07520 [Lentzea sp. NPDC058436]|uniref:hypothetical protein n=1 Tax=Lentzea sp. NPDC058436 TaxID=3346499 RepID=UPI003650B455